MKRGKYKMIYEPVTALLYSVLSVISALVIAGILMEAMGFHSLYSYRFLFQGSFGSINSLCETLVKTTPIILTAVAFSVAFKSGMINLGTTGQLYMGAVCTTLAATNLGQEFREIHLFLSLLAGIIAGALFGYLVSLLKSIFGASELITTIMLNYIATYFVSFLVTGPMKDTTGSNSNPQSYKVLDSAKLPIIVPDSRLNAGIIIALIMIVLYFVFFWHTSLGYSIRVVGLNENAGKYAGISKNFNQGTAMAISGGIAGLAGAIEIVGIQTRMTQGFAGNLGFEGIAAALLGNNSPIGILFSSLLFGAMSSGAGTMEMLAKVPNAYIYIIQGLIILFVIGRNMPIQRIKRIIAKSKVKKEG